MYLIKKSDVYKIAEELSKTYQVYGPVVEKESGQTFLVKTDDPKEIDLTAPIPVQPPKSVVFPQIEKIFSYRYDKNTKIVDMQQEFKVEPKAIFGLRSCDLEGMICLDRFMLGQEFVDDVYLAHRKQMFIVTNTCIEPFEQCFCVCTDSGPCAKENFDINLTELGDHYLVEAGSGKGEELVQALGLEKADTSFTEKKSAAIDKSISKFETIATDNKAWISRVMNRMTTGFTSSDVWEYIGNQCFECGACTFVCPSCSCFNIEDVNRTSGESVRIREWDSCSFEGYTLMAGDHNPRKPVEDRRNKRFFCKLSYSQSKKYLRPGCVGCGRCAWVCPGDIGLPNVVTYIRRETTEKVEQ